MAIEYPLIRGKRYDWSSVECIIQPDGAAPLPPLRGWLSLDWGISRSGAYTYGNSAEPTGQTRGRVAYTASASLNKEEWDHMRDQIGEGYGELPMTFLATWLEGSNESKVEIIGATIIDESESGAEDGPPEVTLELLPTRIIVNGVPFLRG